MVVLISQSAVVLSKCQLEMFSIASNIETVIKEKIFYIKVINEEKCLLKQSLGAYISIILNDQSTILLKGYYNGLCVHN